MSKKCDSNINNPNGNYTGTIPPRPLKHEETDISGIMSQVNNFVKNRMVIPEPENSKQTINPPGPARSRLPDVVYFPPRGLNIYRKELQCPSPSETNCNISNNVIEVYKDPYSKCEVNSTRYNQIIKNVNNVKGKNINLIGNITLGQTFPNQYYSTSYKGYLNYKKCKFPTSFNVNSSCDVSNNNSNPSYCGNLVVYNKNNQYPNRNFLTDSAVTGSARINRLRYKTISSELHNYPENTIGASQRCGQYIGGQSSYQNIHKKPVICNVSTELARIRGTNINFDACRNLNTIKKVDFVDSGLDIIITKDEGYNYWKNIINSLNAVTIGINSLTVTSSAVITDNEFNDLVEPIILVTGNVQFLGPPSVPDVNVLKCFCMNNVTSIGGLIAVSQVNSVEEISFPELASIYQGIDLGFGQVSIIIQFNGNLKNINFPKLTTTNGSISVYQNVELLNIDLLLLEDMLGDFLSIGENSKLEKLELPQLENIMAEVRFIDNTVANSIELKKVTTLEKIEIKGNTKLTIIDISGLESVTDNITIDGNGDGIGTFDEIIINNLTDVSEVIISNNKFNNSNDTTILMNDLTSINTLTIHGNTFDGSGFSALRLNSLTTINTITISSNIGRVRAFFPQLTTIDNLTIKDNKDFIGTIVEFPVLTSVSKLFNITYNTSLDVDSAFLGNSFPKIKSTSSTFSSPKIVAENGIRIYGNSDDSGNNNILRVNQFFYIGGKSGANTSSNTYETIYQFGTYGGGGTLSEKTYPGGIWYHSSVTHSETKLVYIIGGADSNNEPVKKVRVFNGDFVVNGDPGEDFTVQDLPSGRIGCKVIEANGLYGTDMANKKTLYVVGGGNKIIDMSGQYIEIDEFQNEILMLNGNVKDGYTWETVGYLIGSNNYYDSDSANSLYGFGLATDGTFLYISGGMKDTSVGGTTTIYNVVTAFYLGNLNNLPVFPTPTSRWFSYPYNLSVPVANHISTLYYENNQTYTRLTVYMGETTNSSQKYSQIAQTSTTFGSQIGNFTTYNFSSSSYGNFSFPAFVYYRPGRYIDIAGGVNITTGNVLNVMHYSIWTGNYGLSFWRSFPNSVNLVFATATFLYHQTFDVSFGLGHIMFDAINTIVATS